MLLEGGACGYTDAVSKPPFNSFVSAGNGPLFKKGLGCGACYQVHIHIVYTYVNLRDKYI